jgi:lysophospholipase L1-like esterase
MKRMTLALACMALAGATCSYVADAQVGAPAQGNAPATPAAAPQARGGGRGNFQQIRTGPSAEVPAAVAIPRPSADELTQINGALKKFVESDTSAAAPLLKKYESLITVPPPRLNVAATYTPTNVRNPRHEAFVERAKQGDIDLLLDGDSITDWWVQGAAKKAIFEKYFGNIKTANFAVAGDTTQGVLWGLKNGEGQGFQPKAIMLMIGTNNMAANTAPEIAEGIGAITLEMRKDFPNAKILLLAIFPRGNPGDPIREKITECNNIIKRLDDGKNVFYMDIGPKFLDEGGKFLPDSFQNDLLHPAPKGYDIWGEAVKDKLAELMK